MIGTTATRRLRGGTPLLLTALMMCAGFASGREVLRAEEPDPVAALEATLAGENWDKRLIAIERLESIAGDRASRALTRSLGDTDWGVQARAATALGKRGDKASLGDLARLAIDGEVELVRAAARDAMATLDAAGAAERLLQGARQSRDSRTKARCLDAYGMTAGGAQAKALRDFATAKEPEVAAAAVRALGRIAGRDPAARDEAIAVLERVLVYRSERKQFFAYVAALEALGRTTDPRAVPLIVGEVSGAIDDDRHSMERAARALTPFDPAAVSGAIRAAFARARQPEAARRLLWLAGRMRLEATRPEIVSLLSHGDERVRSESARVLGVFGGDASAGALDSAFKDKSARVRREVVSALARAIEPKSFRSFSGKVSADPSEEVRLQYVVELADAGDPKGISVLDAFVDDPSWRVASAALVSVGTLGIETDLGLVEPRTKDKDWRIRAAAYEAMGRLRASTAIPLLAAGLSDRDPVVKGVCLANLQILTREKGDGNPAFWTAWYAENGAGMNLVKRSRRSAEEKAADETKRPKYAHEIRKYGVEVMQKARIIVVSGAWDKVQIVLGHLGIPHTLLRAQELKVSGLNPNQIVLVNCEGNVDKDSAERLQWFVNVGGYLMSSDWALTKAVNTCFPGYLKQFAGANTGNDVVVVEEASPGHPFTQGVFTDVPAMMWWLEIQAFPLHVEYPERCDILVDSAEMKQKYGSSPMAAAFRWGLGKVQHSLSHFYLQEEGMARAAKPRDRMIFAVDHLGLTMDQIRPLVAEGRFDGKLNEETMKLIAPDYSMFRMIVNVVAEKSRWVEDL